MGYMRRLVSTLTVAGIVIAALVTTPAGANAAGIGSGEAIIRIDANKAKVSKNAKGGYTLTMPKNSAGQWLGERSAADGTKRVRVGDVTARQLATLWKNFRYASDDVRATLTWNSNRKVADGASVWVSKPVVTASGVTFAMTLDDSLSSGSKEMAGSNESMSGVTLPTSLKNVSLNLRRGDDNKRARTSYYPFSDVWLTWALHYSAGMYNYDQVDARLYNEGNNNTCWKHTFPGTNPATSVDLSGRCDDINYSNGVSWYGIKNGDQRVNSLNVTLQPDGEASFVYSAWVLDW